MERLSAKCCVSAGLFTAAWIVTGAMGLGQTIPPQKPKLIVGITISGMQYEYLSAYWDKFGEDGFRKMATTGANCQNARYEYMITDPGAGYASIASGTIPADHGIVADYWYDRLKNEIIYCIDDPQQHTVGGAYGNGAFSPRYLNSTTLSDEVRISSRFRSRSVGIAMDPEAAVLMAGHTATAAYWYDPERGDWISGSYYMDSLPDWVRDFNEKKYPDLYLDRTWETLLPISDYEESVPDNNELEEGINGQNTFPYNLAQISMKNKDQRDYRWLMSTPFGNTYTKDMAIAAIVNEGLGKGGGTDMIQIAFNSTGHLAGRYTTWSVEMEDTYLRLDRDIAHFLEFLDGELGLENVLIFLTAENALAADPRYLSEHRIPSGYFNYRTSTSLLRSYLNAVYGQGDWVTFYYAHHIYLNHQLIEDSRLSLDEVQDRVSRFMVQMNGVSNALQAHVLQSTNFTGGTFQRIQNSYYQKRSGDVIIYLTPGWVERSSLSSDTSTEFKFASHVPLIFYGWKIRRATIPYRVSPTDIATTIASFLGISMPDNASGVVIQDITR